MSAPTPTSAPAQPPASLAEAQYQAVLDATVDAVVTVDTSGLVVEFNAAACRLFGYRRAEALGQDMAELIIPPEYRERHRSGFARYLAGIGTSGFVGHPLTLTGLHRSGRSFPIDITITSVEAEGVRLFVAAIRDASEREELERSQQTLQSLFDHALDAMLIFDDQGRFLEANPAACQLFAGAREQIVGHAVRDFYASSDRLSFDQFWGLFQRDRCLRGTGTMVRLDGKRGQIEISAVADFTPGRHLAVVRDVTERQKLEEQLRQSQKMEAVGQLTGGVAHEFNNLLTAVAGYAEFARDRAQGYDDEELCSDLQEIEDAANRARGLTGQLLAFSRRQMMRPRPLSLNEVVSGVHKLIRQLIGEHIDIRLHLDEGLGTVMADPGQLEQVLVNLAVNARDAMPQGGVLTVETSNLLVDEDHTAASNVPPGDYVVLAVSDDGQGMDEETLERAFEPFYTTKEVGAGTGLGLSTVYGIIAQSGGEIHAYSEPAVGTTFRIYLPRIDSTATPTTEENKDMETSTTGAETILLVEDENVVRRLVKKMLDSQGYTVVDAEDPEQALAIAASGEHQFDLLVTDVVMPKMNGKELAERLVSRQPSLKVIYTSGYTANAIKNNGQLDPDMVMLQKPFNMQDLISKVREVLDAPLPA